MWLWCSSSNKLPNSHSFMLQLTYKYVTDTTEFLMPKTDLKFPGRFFFFYYFHFIYTYIKASQLHPKAFDKKGERVNRLSLPTIFVKSFTSS